jgi:hypothetical protein
VVSAGLRQLELPDPVGEAQLRAEIRPAYDAYRAAPSRTVPAERVLDGIQQRYEAARASGRR